MDFPNLPYFLDLDNNKVTETLAIHYYIADKWNPDLLGKTVEERAIVEMLKGVVMDVKQAITKPLY